MRRAPVRLNATRACELLVGLPDVRVLAVEEPAGGRLRVTVESRTERPACGGCGALAWSKDRPCVELVDLACFGRPARLVWRSTVVLPDGGMPDRVLDR